MRIELELYIYNLNLIEYVNSCERPDDDRGKTANMR